MLVRFVPLVLALVFSVAVTATAATARSASGTVVKAAYNKDLKATILVTAGGLTVYEYQGDAPLRRSSPLPVRGFRPAT